ncbi:MAG TPA: DUF3943 domain-containing protein [Kofleriaceae bacterium]
MIRRSLMSVAVTGALVASAAAQSPPEPAPQPGPAAQAEAAQQNDLPEITEKEDLPVRKRSYLVPAAEILLFNLSLSVGAYAAGMDWATRDSDTWFAQLGTPWELDDDAYTTNQLAHPLQGSLSFTAARSTGHEFWVSGIYGFASSMLWEAIIENETPSINDMITTPIGGMFIGEAVHRFARALLYRGYGKPGLARRAAAAVLDPVDAINRSWWGEAWRKTVPPSLYAHFGVGYQQPTSVLGNRGGDAQFHVEAYVEHGLLGDRAFEPRRPFDHFELYAALNAGTDNLEGDLNVRGVLLGGGVWREDIRGMYGLFGAYDWNNNDYVRASMLGVGPGATAELELSNRSYVGGTLAAYLVPYGAAGGYREVEGGMRDSHDGPGMAQLAELKFGHRGLYQVKATTRAYEIAGRMVGDTANEYVIQTTLATRLQVRRYHAIGLEATHSYERASFASLPVNVMDSDPNRTTDFRAFYAITTDEILGR